MASEIVPLIELVPATELAPDGVLRRYVSRRSVVPSSPTMKSRRQRTLERLEQRRVEADNPHQLFGIGKEFDELGCRDDAVACWRRVVELEPAHSTAWFHLGVAAREAGRWQDALARFDRACALDPDDQWSLHCRGRVYQELGEGEFGRADLERAIEIYTEVLVDESWDPELWFWRGAARARLGERDAALADLAQAIARDPDRREEARREVDYRPLADDPEFIRLTAAGKAKRARRKGRER